MFFFSPGSYFGFMDVTKMTIPFSSTIGWHIVETLSFNTDRKGVESCSIVMANGLDRVVSLLG